MSKARFDMDAATAATIPHALNLLNEALTIVDTLPRPEIGARLQHVIDSVEELQERAAA
ncbi:MAG: hypothetical protein V4502_10260 [Pseudomonadota bacterium]